MLNSQPNLCCRVQAYQLDEPSPEMGLIGSGSGNIAEKRAVSPLLQHHDRQQSPVFRMVAVETLANALRSNQFRPISEKGNNDVY